MTNRPMGANGPPEGQGRKWGKPAKVPETPMCIVGVEWPKCKGDGLRLDLDAIAFAEYIVGADAGRPRSSARGVATRSKGPGGAPVQMFVSHPLTEMSKSVQEKFAKQWWSTDSKLAGQDKTRWKLQQAWAVHLLRRPLFAKRYRLSAREQNQFRLRLLPEPSAGFVLTTSDRMEEFARRFMAGLEADFAAETKQSAHFIWMAAAHYHETHPHVHIGMRGITVEGDHVYFSQQYLRPTRRELEQNPKASGPIDWRARGILAEMLNPEKNVAHAG